MSKTTPGFDQLRHVLDMAYAQAASGKGMERHGSGDDDFLDQPMFALIKSYGQGFALGQAAKKLEESQRLDKDAAIAERLGAIVYTAATIIALQNSR